MLARRLKKAKLILRINKLYSLTNITQSWKENIILNVILFCCLNETDPFFSKSAEEQIKVTKCSS